jgi:hypothetical protein
VVQPALEVRPALPIGPSTFLLWCVCLVHHDHDEFGLLGAGARNYTLWDPA